MERVWGRIVNDRLTRRQLIAGAETLLKRLRAEGVKIVIVTNNTVEEQHAKLRHLGITSLIDVLVISEEVGIAKPHPRIFEAALERVGCQCHEVVMVGDSWANDVLGAQGVGIRTIWLNRFGEPCPDKRMTMEINALEPIETLMELLMNGGST